jgi:hypothetical protein
MDEQELAKRLQIGVRMLLGLPADARIAVFVDLPRLRSDELKDVPYVLVSEIEGPRLQTLLDNASGAKRFAETTAAHAIQLAKGKVRG